MSNTHQPSDHAGNQNEKNKPVYLGAENPGLLTHLGERIGDLEHEIDAANTRRLIPKPRLAMFPASQASPPSKVKR